MPAATRGDRSGTRSSTFQFQTGARDVNLIAHRARPGRTAAPINWRDRPESTRHETDPNRGANPKALDPGIAFIISSILGDDNNRALVFGRGTPLHLTDHLAAAKTGTTEDYHDGLTVGWTPDLVSVFWIGDVMGGDTPDHVMTGQSDGVYVAAPAWHKFMEGALKGVPANHWYTPPSDVVRGSGNNWFLVDVPSIKHLPNDTLPSPTPGDGNGNGGPGDQGTGPLPIIGGGPRGRPSPVPGGGIIPPIGG